MGDSNKSILNTITSGAKIMTGTKTVITNQARNMIQNAHRNTQNVIKNLHSSEIEIELDHDNDGEADTELEISKNELLPINRNKIKEKATKILKESMYEPPSQMGQGATMIRNVVNPYNPKRKSESIVNQKDRFKTKDNIYPKVKVDNSIMDKRVRKVRTYLYKVNGVPVARKLEHQPHQPFEPAT